MTKGETPAQNWQELAQRLKRQPELSERIERLLEIVENADGDSLTADEVEERVVEEIRRIGHDALQGWARRKAARLEGEDECRAGLERRGKKRLYWQTRFGQVGVDEQVWRGKQSNHVVRPFVQAARVSCRGYSVGLQRVVTDFAADSSFAAAVEKVREHYGVEVCAGTVRAITEGHAALMSEETETAARMPASGVRQMIGEMDGSSIPCVKIEENKGDRRKQRVVSWHEAKLCMAEVVGRAQPRFGATMPAAEQAGRQWRQVAIEAGAGQHTQLHCVGDGARWIVAQVHEQFGAQADYLLDFYHVSEYLAAAGQAIARQRSRAWLTEQQVRLKENKVAEVFAELARCREPAAIADAEAPVRRCERYLRDRQAYLNYQRAIAAGLPIGSGEIESGHRSVVQARLKISGAWWLVENAEKMLALRVTRANGEWQSYWRQQRQAHA